ncbi:MAG: Holliday junction resolvase RuvX [Candidatus Izemoplasmatales bacterium]|jgi:putative Holliday junction resolvase
MRYLGLDLGTKTLGIAMSDPSGIIASAYETFIFAENDYESAARKVVSLVQEFKIKGIILGLPRNMDGTLGFQAHRSEDFQTRLSAMVTVPVILWDERLTTKVAEQTMTKAKTKTKHKKQIVDRLAATILLQSYLDKQRSA